MNYVNVIRALNRAAKGVSSAQAAFQEAYEANELESLLAAIEQEAKDIKIVRATLAKVKHGEQAAGLTILDRKTKGGNPKVLNRDKYTPLAEGEAYWIVEKVEAEQADPFEAILKKAQKLADDGDDRAALLLKAYADAVEA